MLRACEVGHQISKLMSYEMHEITLIDIVQESLDNAFNNLDILPVKGDAPSRSVLTQADISKTDLYMSVTTSEHTNLVSAILAKKMGAKRTRARVGNPDLMDPEQLQVFHEVWQEIMSSPSL